MRKPIFFVALSMAFLLMSGTNVFAGFDENGEWSDPSLPVTTFPQPDGGIWGIGGVSQSFSAAATISPPWDVYENWTSPFIRSDRWIVATGRAHEARREVLGRHLLMRFRLQGTTLLDTGFTSANQSIQFVNPNIIKMIEADFQVEKYTVVGSEANQSQPGTRVRPVQISLPGFNDGSSTGTGDMTGDHFMRIMINREAFTTDPPGMLTVQAFLFRCIDATCSNAISNLFNLDMGKVFVGEPFSLRAIKDRPNNRFVVGFNNNQDVFLYYNPDLDQSRMVVPFADIRMQSVNANCMAGPTVTDSEIKVREIRTEAKAVIP